MIKRKFNQLVIIIHKVACLCFKMDTESSPLIVNAPMEVNRRMTNVVVLGLAFMFLFTAFQTLMLLEKNILNSINKEDPTIQVDGYTSQCILYGVFAIANWIVPWIVKTTGPRFSIFVGAVIYVLFIVSFFKPLNWIIYTASGVLGFGAAIIWTGQGTFLTLNSNAKTMTRNTGIFWALFQMSMLIGNVYMFFQLGGADTIDKDTRTLLFTVLTVVGSIGVLLVLALRRVTRETATGVHVEVEGDAKGVVETFVGALKMLTEREMILLSITAIYTGIELSFYSGVYSACIGFTKKIGDNALQMVGLSGVLIGVGEVLGGVIFGMLGSKTNKWGRDPIVILGLVLHIFAFILIFLNLPNNAPFDDTQDVSFFTQPSAILAVFCSFLLGFGDSCFNTQLYSIFGVMYADRSAEAFALFKFTQSMAAAVCFFFASSVGLHAQLAVLAVMAVIGAATFVTTERGYKRQAARDADD